MIPSKIDAVNTQLPFPNILRKVGTNTTIPKNPYTTDGIPARRSTAGFTIL